MNIEDLRLFVIEMETAKENLRQAKERFVKENSKLKVGDIVPVTGYSHQGKSIVVDRIYFGDRWRGKGIVASGMVLKNDGTIGIHVGEHLELKVDL